jgi:hypothetical protein
MNFVEGKTTLHLCLLERSILPFWVLSSVFPARPSFFWLNSIFPVFVPIVFVLFQQRSWFTELAEPLLLFAKFFRGSGARQRSTRYSAAQWSRSNSGFQVPSFTEVEISSFVTLIAFERVLVLFADLFLFLVFFVA